MIPREAIIQAVTIPAWLESNGIAVVRSGKEAKACCPFHNDRSPSMTIDEGKAVWFCFPCGIGGSVIDLEVRKTGKKVKDAMIDLAKSAGIWKEEYEQWRKVATYEYKDALGRPVMNVDRNEAGREKKFGQWRIDSSGKRINGIEGVNRVLFRMEKWAGKAEVALCEGEKCVEALETLGYDATTNPGGSNGWMDAYASFLADKHVDIWPDTDQSGSKWLDSVLKSLEGKVASLRVLCVPSPYNDVADILDCQGGDIASASVRNILAETSRIPRGVVMPLLSAEECYTLYRKRVNSLDQEGVDLSRWLPGLRSCSRVLLPGDMAVILSDTGVGKTTIMTNIARSQNPIPTIYFELELSAEAMCERFIALGNNVDTLSVEQETKRGKKYDLSMWGHVWICPDSKITLEQMETLINRAELRIGTRPKLILVDYIGLMGGGQGKRYERLSTIAEGLKILAKATNTVVVVASQIRRKEQGDNEVGLHDAKDSGSIECSAQLVLAATRPTVDSMVLTVLKQTKRAGRVEIQCRFNGDRQQITEITDEGN